ncbi:DMT family transporter [Falcatimonas sp. MSJ-15]|uniref:DMT family transporter n=1 Tax=Falcatimonas sp. MSJ-15 TaxID=2841515 RepID=UPI001C0F537C|nr:DMT family transporter [Falcatimonas sp. MSJ-15]MBU5469985.1 DMT family transporter [Falcatimonas sp. MSJ-15]
MENKKNTNEKENFLQKTLVVALLAAICTFLWGSAFPCIKIGYRLFDIPSDNTYTQILFAGIRFTLAGILTILIGSVLNRELLVPKKKSIPNIIKLSMFQTVLQYIFFYMGLARTSGVKSSIIEGSNTFIAILIACLVFKQEKLNLKKILGCVIGFAGVVLVNITKDGIDMNMTFMGEGAILMSAVAYAISSGLIKIYSKDDNPVMLSGYQFLFGGILLMIAGFAMGGRITQVNPQGIMMLIYLACISAVAYSLWGVLLKYNPVSKVAVFGFMNPVFGVILSAWWLNETGNDLGVKALIALVFVCIGIYIVNRKDKVTE